MNCLNVNSRTARRAPRWNKFKDGAADLPARTPRYSAASIAFFDLRGALAALATARFFDLAVGAAFGAAAFLAGAPRAGRLRRALDPPLLSARASISPTASSSVMVSGVFSFGRLALMPLWLT